MTERASGRCYANLDAIPGERFIKCAYHKAGGKPRNPCGPKDAGRAVAEYHDARYDYSVCAGCGQSYQNIDFRGNPHVSLCNDVRPSAQKGGSR